MVIRVNALYQVSVRVIFIAPSTKPFRARLHHALPKRVVGEIAFIPRGVFNQNQPAQRIVGLIRGMGLRAVLFIHANKIAARVVGVFFDMAIGVGNLRFPTIVTVRGNAQRVGNGKYAA